MLSLSRVIPRLVNNVVPVIDHFVVFVVYNNKFENPDLLPDIFIVPSMEISFLTDSFGEEGREKRIMKGRKEQYRNKWEYIVVGYGEDGEIDESEEGNVISRYGTVLQLRKIGNTSNEICNQLGVSDDELKDLEIRYNVITGQ